MESGRLWWSGHVTRTIRTYLASRYRAIQQVSKQTKPKPTKHIRTHMDRHGHTHTHRATTDHEPRTPTHTTAIHSDPHTNTHHRTILFCRGIRTKTIGGRCGLHETIMRYSGQ